MLHQCSNSLRELLSLPQVVLAAALVLTGIWQ
jgi:hypothetical protein